MDRRLLFIINPKSGRTEIRTYALEALETLQKSGFEVTVFITQKKNDAFEKVVREGESYSRIVCCGGDGTADEVVNGIMALEKKPEFAVMPTGTTNDYAFNLNIPSNIPAAAKIVGGNTPFQVDIGKFLDKYFTYIAAFGTLTEITYETPQDAKNIFGYLAYILEGAKRISAIKSYQARVEYDEGVIEGSFIFGLFSNSISLGGLRTAYTGTELDDGLLEAVLIKEPTTLLDVQSTINVLLSIEHLDDAKGEFVQAVRSKKFRITTKQPIKWTLDGESGGVHNEVTIENVPKAITVIRGKKKL